ncbi:hypothetical protein [Roseibacillus ishigakijimensis]|uniref:Uncharacterized protein n=1 Tax=Roseibacillus ishigakijimensis TaxID=454146 RepID=A0A934RLX1_9BACT|nr:hypothetical protein [Roseibacillus ishigakijimensis]MBK1833243.1 hypothetical protein [Roseibacillus ishigakijimensis]
MKFPLDLRFKILAFAPQANVVDADGQQVCYFKQKLFRFREKVEVYTDSSRQTLLATITANKILDWSARYTFHDAEGNEIGSVGRQGMRSLWKAHYDVFNPGDNRADFAIREENPWTKVMDGFFGEIPILNMITGFLFHPAYLARRADGSDALRLKKQPAFLEGKFIISKLGDLEPREELNLLLSFLMLNLLERRRG